MKAENQSLAPTLERAKELRAAYRLAHTSTLSLRRKQLRKRSFNPSKADIERIVAINRFKKALH